MALTKFPLSPAGVFKDETPSAAEGSITDASGHRIVRGRWQLIGGYETASPTSLGGKVRGCHAWSDLAGSTVVAMGTADKLQVLYGGSVKDITPYKGKGTLVDPFATENGNTLVYVLHVAHGLQDGDVVTYALADAVGGITINGAYTVTIQGFDVYTITHSIAATSTATGGGNVEWTAAFSAGLEDAIGSGYGVGNYGSGVYGGLTEAETRPRIWACDNWGNLGVFVPYNGALYEYQPLPGYNELVTSGDMSTAADWTAGTGWTVAAGVATAVAGVASDLSQDLTGLISGGVTYDVTFDVVRTAGAFQFRVVTEASGSPVDITFGETISKSGSYNRRITAPANPTLIKFSKDNAFAGTIDNVSVKIVSTAYRLHDAPQYSRWMFVDPQRFVVLLGTMQQNGEFNAMCVRWSDQENNRTWTADADTLAGEYVLARGSEIRGGVASRGQNYIWTDEALYSMRFVGGTDVFRFDYVAGSSGLMAPNAFKEFNGVIFWMGTDGNFHMHQGGTPQILDCPMQKDFYDNLTKAQSFKCAAGVNPQFSEVWFSYPDGRDGDGIECSRMAIYNWSANAWYPHQIARTDWLGQGGVDYPLGFGTDGTIYKHEFGNTANGDVLEAFLETGALDLGEGDTWFNVMRFVPDLADQQGSVSVTFSTRQWPNDSWTAKPAITVSTADLKKDLRFTGRQMKLRFDISASPAFYRMGDIKLDVNPSGARR